MAFIIHEYKSADELMDSLTKGVPVGSGPIETTINPLNSSEICNTSIHNSSKDKFEIAQENYKRIHGEMLAYCNENETSIHPGIRKILDTCILKEDSDSLSVLNFTILYEQLADWIEKNPKTWKSYTTHLMWFHDKIHITKVFFAKAISA